MIDPVHFAAWLAAARTVADLVRRAGALLPGSLDGQSAVEERREAALTLKLANARLACDLGYPLCLCVFPPKPMLWDKARRAFVCRASGCGREERSG